MSTDKGSVTGFVLAIGGIVGGLLLEGGNLRQILQPTAAIIVLGGTLGAVMVAFPLDAVLTAFQRIGTIFFGRPPDYARIAATMVELSNRTRRDGIVSLDKELASISDPFLRRALMIAVDGTPVADLRHMMESEIELRMERDEEIPGVFESAGGFSPTVGILGAVLGLIQVMQHLDNIEEVGRGIAVAFVATVYGVGFANLFCLPAAAKLKARQRERWLAEQIMLEGVISIVEGLNPRMLEVKLAGYLEKSEPAAKQKPRAGSRNVQPIRASGFVKGNNDDPAQTRAAR